MATNAAPIPFVPIPSICFQIEIPINVAGRTATAFSRKVTKLAIAVSSIDS